MIRCMRRHASHCSACEPAHPLIRSLQPPSQETLPEGIDDAEVADEPLDFGSPEPEGASATVAPAGGSLLGAGVAGAAVGGVLADAAVSAAGVGLSGEILTDAALVGAVALGGAPRATGRRPQAAGRMLQATCH